MDTKMSDMRRFAFQRGSDGALALLGLWLALGLSACVPILSAWDAKMAEFGDRAAYAFCAKGSGPPLTGEGKIVGIITNVEFKGVISIGEQCQMFFDAWTYYVAEQRAKERKPSGAPVSVEFPSLNRPAS